nr:MAG TPA: hypothetical protein [Caudoviricetes sp.]
MIARLCHPPFRLGGFLCPATRTPIVIGGTCSRD